MTISPYFLWKMASVSLCNNTVPLNLLETGLMVGCRKRSQILRDFPSFHGLCLERLGFYIIASRFFATLIQERLVDLRCCLLAVVRKFQGKLTSLKRVSSPNSQDNF